MTSKYMWRFIGRLGGASSSTVPAVPDFLQLSRVNVARIIELTSHFSQETLNPSQCRSVSSKLLNTLESIERMLCFLDGDKSFLNAALESFYLVSERAKELVESCGSVDWCKASTFQIQNEEAFKEILLETFLCYSVILELFEGKVGARYHEDLRTSSTFEPPSSADVSQDQLALIERLRAVVEGGVVPVSQHQHLARYLLTRVLSQSNAEDFDVCMWPDDQLGKQKIEGTLLGKNVMKARWLDVLCAIKVFENYEYEEGQEELIVKEARILARLNHPNIVKFICCGHNNETSRDYIAMELMEQGLHSLIANLRKAKNREEASSPFPLLSAMDIMLQISYGACYLHENGVAHRDIKSGNVVVRQITTPHLKNYLQVKLVDFGLSKSKLRSSKSNTISHPKTGTAVKMPPEAFNEGRANWFKADVYSFSILCSVILSGKEPFPEKEFKRSRLYEALRSGTRPMIPSGTPPELTSLIQECWSTDRNRRPDFVDICTRLATLRHKLLRGGDSFQPPVHIQEMIKKRSDARQQGSLRRMRAGLLQNQMFDYDAEPHKNDDSRSSVDYPVWDSSPATVPHDDSNPYDGLSHLFNSDNTTPTRPITPSVRPASVRQRHTPRRGYKAAVFDYDAEPHKNDDSSSSVDYPVWGSSPATHVPHDDLSPYDGLRHLFNSDNTTPTRPITPSARPASTRQHHSPRNGYRAVIVVLFVPQCCSVQCQVDIKRCLFGFRGTDHVEVNFDYQIVTVHGVASEEKILKKIKTIRSGARLYNYKRDGKDSPRPANCHSKA